MTRAHAAYVVDQVCLAVCHLVLLHSSIHD